MFAMTALPLQSLKYEIGIGRYTRVVNAVAYEKSGGKIWRYRNTLEC